MTEDIRLKACRLFGIQNIELYNGFKGDKDDIQRVGGIGLCSHLGVGEEQEDGTFTEAVVYQRPH